MPPSDPWDVEAAKIKPSGSPQTGAPAANAEDYSVWNKTTGVSPAGGGQGLRAGIESRINDPGNVPDSGWRGQIEKFGQGAAQGITQPLLHPLKALGAMLEQAPPGMLFDAATGRKNPGQQMGESLVNQPANTLGNLAGGFALAHTVPAITGATSAAWDTLRPTPSPNIVPPEEMAARKLTAAVSPDPSRASNYIKAAQKEVPNVLDFAKQQNNPLKTQLEFNKAAEGSAQATRSHYENNVLGPNANESVRVPESYGGRTFHIGEARQPTATLGDIDKRVVQINKELSAPNAKLNEADSRAALASKASLEAEHAQLTDILHRSLSNLTGIAPEEIANLRQRVGRSYELANDTNAAVTRRGLQEGKPKELGRSYLTQIPMKAVDFLRGGPNAIADRSFQGAIKNFPGQAEPLPQPTYPQPRPAPPLGRPPTLAPPKEPYAPAIENTADRGAQVATQARNSERFQEAQSAKKSALDEKAQQAAANLSTRGKRLALLAQKKGLPLPGNQ